MPRRDHDRKLGRFGEPATLILLSLSEGPKHGYAIMTDVEETMGVALGPGTLYGAISKLVKLKLIQPLDSEDRARPYEITPQGRLELKAFLDIWAPIVNMGKERMA